MLVKDKEVIRIVHAIIKRDTRHPSDSYSFEDVYEEIDYEEVLNGKGKPNPVYKLDYRVDYGDDKYEEYWGVVDKEEVMEFIKEERNEKLNTILNEDNQLD